MVTFYCCRLSIVFVMFSGIGIVVLNRNTFKAKIAARRGKARVKTEVQPKLLSDETKTAIKNKIDRIEYLTEEDF